MYSKPMHSSLSTSSMSSLSGSSEFSAISLTFAVLIDFFINLVLWLEGMGIGNPSIFFVPNLVTRYVVVSDVHSQNAFVLTSYTSKGIQDLTSLCNKSETKFRASFI
jgi:hypothetical protein